MKKYIILILSFSFLIFSGQKKNNSGYSGSKPIEKTCLKSVDFGDTSLCLPQIVGMNDVIKIEKIQNYAKSLSGNSVLVFYVNDLTFQNIDKFGEFTFDDYFVISVREQMKNIVVQNADLNQINDVFLQNNITKKWKDIEPNLSKVTGYNFDKPIIVESYSLVDNSRGFVFIVKFNRANKVGLSILIMNILNIKNRIFFATYTKTYEDDDSFKSAKAINDNIVHKLLELNK